MNETTTPEEAAAAVDLISKLCDNVLLGILSFLPSATDVTRTSVLSKRWRHLHSITPFLRFAVGAGSFAEDDEDEEKHDADCHDAARRIIAGVDATLTERDDKGGDVDDLEISLVYSSPYNDKFFKRKPVGTRYYYHDHRHEGDIAPSQVQSWLRFAERHVRGSFLLEVPLNAAAAAKLDLKEASTEEEEEGELIELPNSSRAELMSLSLGDANTKVPIVRSGAFHALTDFTLSRAKINPYKGDDLYLARLLSSSCCPQLRRVQLSHIAGLIQLPLVNAPDTLEELRLAYLPDLRRLILYAAGLRVLRVRDCNLHCSDPASARVSAPRLEVLSWDNLVHLACREFIDTPTVRQLKDLPLFSHGVDETNAAAVCLLKNCSVVDDLEVKLTVRVLPSEDTVKDIPHLPTVTNLTFDVNTYWYGHTVGASLARIIAKCNNIEHLYIRVRGLSEVCSDPKCNCSQPEGWEDQSILLEHLKKVVFRGFIPCYDRKSLLGLLLKNAPALEKITVKIDPSYIQVREKIDFNMPGYQGFWTPCQSKYRETGYFTGATKYEWKREKATEEAGL